MSKYIIAPSVLSLDYSKATEQMEELVKSEATWLHFDVMDGHFVPNITFGPDILRGMKQKTNLFMDVHLMITDPEKYAPVFVKNGADLITFHYEVYNDIDKCIELAHKIHALGAQCGISVKPGTPVEVLLPILKHVELVLIMSVEPGFGGQSFQEASLDKIAWLKTQKDTNNYDYKIEIDGGINAETCTLAKNAGCEVFVAGSYIFKQDIVKGVASLL